MDICHIKCPKIALDRFRKHNVVILGLQMPSHCCGSEPPVSISTVLLVHSLGVSNASSGFMKNAAVVDFSGSRP